MQLPRVAPQLADWLQQRKPAYAMCRFFPIRFFRLRHFNDRLKPAELRYSVRSRRTNLAGEEGFEPPLSVLETDGLPLNLLPFTLRARRQPLFRPAPKHVTEPNCFCC